MSLNNPINVFTIPGMTIPLFFTPTMTTKEFLDEIKGTAREGKGYEISCAQLFGN